MTDLTMTGFKPFEMAAILQNLHVSPPVSCIYMIVKSLATLHSNNVLLFMYSISHPHLQMYSQCFLHLTITALPTCHLHTLTQGVHLLSSLCSVSRCQVPLICTNTHLQPTIEALFKVDTVLIQLVPLSCTRIWTWTAAMQRPQSF